MRALPTMTRTLALIFLAACWMGCDVPPTAPTTTASLTPTASPPPGDPDPPRVPVDPTPETGSVPVPVDPTPETGSVPVPVDPTPETGPVPVWPSKPPLDSEVLVPHQTEWVELDTTSPVDAEIDHVQLSEDGSRVSFVLPSLDAWGNAASDVYVLTVGEGTARLVARGVRDFGWSGDGRIFAVARLTGIIVSAPSVSQDEVALDVVDTEAWTTVTVDKGMEWQFVFDEGKVQVAADGAVAYGDEDDLWIYDPDLSTRTLLSDHSTRPPVFSPDGARLAFAQNSTAGPLQVYDRQTGAIWTLDDLGLAGFGFPGPAANHFDDDGDRLAWITLVSGKRQLKLFDLETGEVRKTPAYLYDFVLSRDWSRAYFITDKNWPALGTLYEWDFETEQEVLIDDQVRGPLKFAREGSRLLYRDNYVGNVVASDPFDLRAWNPETGESVPLAQGLYGSGSFSWLDDAGTMAMVNHHDQGWGGPCTRTVYAVFAEGEMNIEACTRLGHDPDGHLVLGHDDGGKFTLSLWSPWEADMSPLVAGVVQPRLSPDGAHLLYRQIDDDGLESLTLTDLETLPGTPWVQGVEWAQPLALTDHVAVGISRIETEWMLHVATW